MSSAHISHGSPSRDAVRPSHGSQAVRSELGPFPGSHCSHVVRLEPSVTAGYGQSVHTPSVSSFEYCCASHISHVAWSLDGSLPGLHVLHPVLSAFETWFDPWSRHGAHSSPCPGVTEPAGQLWQSAIVLQLPPTGHAVPAGQAMQSLCSTLATWFGPSSMHRIHCKLCVLTEPSEHCSHSSS